jgi:hypothetical protein
MTIARPAPEPAVGPQGAGAPQTTTKPIGTIIHNRVQQVANGGYAKGAIVLADGVIWRSTIAGNLHHPGGGTGQWEFLL